MKNVFIISILIIPTDLTFEAASIPCETNFCHAHQQDTRTNYHDREPRCFLHDALCWLF